MTGIGFRRAAEPDPSPSAVNDAAWRELDAAFREWAQAPTGPRYRAFLDADRRWRGMTERTRPARDAEGAGERRPVLAAN